MQLEVLLYQLKRKRGCLARYSSIIHGGLAHKAQGRVQVPRFPKQGSDIELRSRDLHAKQSTRYFIWRAIRVYHRLRVHFYPRSGIFLRSPLLYVERGRLRGYIDRKPRCSMHAYGNRGRGGGFYCT